MRARRLELSLADQAVADGDEERAALDGERAQLVTPGCYEVRARASGSNGNPLGLLYHFPANAVDLCQNEPPR